MCPSFYLHPLPNSTESIAGNKSLTFLITLDRDLGDLMMLKMHLEASALWRNMWDRVQTMIPWGSPEMKPQLTMGRISVKDGETQERYAEDATLTYHFSGSLIYLVFFMQFILQF